MRMRKLFACATVSIMAGGLFLSWFLSAVWDPDPGRYAQPISVKEEVLASLQGAKILPHKLVNPGTFTTSEIPFKDLTGGKVSHKLDKWWEALSLERWVSQGDGTFYYNFVNLPLPPARDWRYSPNESVWTGTEFQVVFAKDRGSFIFGLLATWIGVWTTVALVILVDDSSRNKLLGRA